MNWQHQPELFNHRTRIRIEKCCTRQQPCFLSYLCGDNAQAIHPGPLPRTQSMGITPATSKGEKSLSVKSTQKEAEPGFCTDGFSKGAPHGKLEPSSIELKACRILLGTGKSPRNQLRQNFPTAFGAPRLHGPLVDSVIGTRLPERLAQF